MGSYPAPYEIKDHQIFSDVPGSARKVGYCFGEVTGSISTLVSVKPSSKFHRTNLKKNSKSEKILMS